MIIDNLNSEYPIEDAWYDLGLPGHPAKSCKSPFRPEKHASFSVFDNGRRFKDFTTGEGGDIIDFVTKALNCSCGEAIKWVRDRIGPIASYSGIKRRTVKPPIFKPSPMPPEKAKKWEEGIAYAGSAKGFQTLGRIDTWRGWPNGTAEILLQDRVFSIPMINGERGLAWPVHYLTGEGLMQVGFHYRFRRRPDQKVKWRYFPRGIPALPFILGSGYFSTSRLVIVLEGQFDAINFAATAGWFSWDTSWPENITVFGIRGASGWRPFLNHYEQHWPKEAKFLLIPDNDEAGKKWENAFAHELAKRAHSVTILPPKGDGQDFSDIIECGQYSPQNISQILVELDLV